jgi:hypothetical protein
MSAPAPRRCRACGREMREPALLGWECECGVAVCTDEECFAEYFKHVAEGEGTRCLTCGLVT